MIANLLLRRIIYGTIQQYRDDGYSITSDIVDSGADITFIKDDEIVLLQMKTRNAETVQPGSSDDKIWATQAYREYPNVRRDILWLPASNIAPMAEISRRIALCKLLLPQSAAATVMLAFSAIESSALRMVSAVQIPPLRVPATSELIFALRENSLIDSEMHEQLNHISRIRNYSAHGFLSDRDIAAQDAELSIELATRLNDSVASRAADLIDSLISEIDVLEDINRENLRREIISRTDVVGQNVVQLATRILDSL